MSTKKEAAQETVEKIKEGLPILTNIGEFPKEFFAEVNRLPKSEDWWIDVKQDLVKIIVPDDKFIHLDKAYEHGWFLALLMRGTSNLLQLQLNLRGPQGSFSYELTNSDLVTLGLVTPVNIGLWSSCADSINSVYTVVLTPSIWIPYRGAVHIAVKNTGTSAAVLAVIQTARIIMIK